MNFKGRTAIVTGAANGIGRATALRLAREGANVAVLDLDKEKAEQTAADIQSLGGTALARAVDVTKPAEVQGAVSAVLAGYQLDVTRRDELRQAFHDIQPPWAPSTFW